MPEHVRDGAIVQGAKVRHLLRHTLGGLTRKIVDLQTFAGDLQLQQLEVRPR